MAQLSTHDRSGTLQCTIADEVTQRGLFHSTSDVSDFAWIDHWLPTKRFAVLSKTTVRGQCFGRWFGSERCDFSRPRTRALQSTLSARAWHSFHRMVLGRSIGVPRDSAPRHRRFAIVVMWDPDSNRLAYFGLIGHSFQLVAVVYNFNRRAGITDILRVAGLVSQACYNDHFGFSSLKMVEVDWCGF